MTITSVKLVRTRLCWWLIFHLVCEFVVDRRNYQYTQTELLCGPTYKTEYQLAVLRSQIQHVVTCSRISRDVAVCAAFLLLYVKANINVQVNINAMINF